LSIESHCHYVIDWNYDEDRNRIRAGHGPENISRLRRFAIGILHHFSDGKARLTKKCAI
jgi:predicted transposase YbfD/YdcC